MNGQLPEGVCGRVLARHTRPDSNEPVPTECSGELLFANGVSASFYCSFRTINQQWAHVSGTNGYLQVNDFVVPFYGNESTFDFNSPSLSIRGCDFNMESHPRHYAVPAYSNGETDSQETNMIRTFSDLVISGRRDPAWGELALKTQKILDACLLSARQDGKLVSLQH
jgi:predicted dehydrogenase